MLNQNYDRSERKTVNYPEEAEAERPQRQMDMEDFWRLVIQDECFAVRQLAIEANNFELKPALITMVKQHQFIGHPSEDPTIIWEDL